MKSNKDTNLRKVKLIFYHDKELDLSDLSKEFAISQFHKVMNILKIRFQQRDIKDQLSLTAAEIRTEFGNI